MSAITIASSGSVSWSTCISSISSGTPWAATSEFRPWIAARTAASPSRDPAVKPPSRSARQKRPTSETIPSAGG